MNQVQLKHQFVRKPPTYVKLEEIYKMENNWNGINALGGAYAFTDPHFRFVHDHKKDWKPVSQPAKHRRFEGTALILQVTPEVFLPLEYKKWPSVMAPIEQHERLHVEDARRIVSADLPTKLKSEPTIKKYFIDRMPIPEATYLYMLPNKMAELVAAEFAVIWNKKKDDQDTPAKYKPVQEAVHRALQKMHP